MNKIAISTLGVENLENFLDKLTYIVEKNKLEDYVSIHYDYIDNDKFIGTKCDIKDLEIICNYYFKIQVHLMANDIDELLNKIIDYDKKERVESIALQYYIDNIIEKIKLSNSYYYTYLAVNPDLEYTDVKYLNDILNGYLLMSVYPGKGGQEFIDITNKYKEFIESGLPINVDGGINDKTIKLKNKNINKFVVGSYLNKDIDNLEEKLLKLVGK